MANKELEQRIASAGWQIDDSFLGHLVIGNDGSSSNNNVSIVAYLDGVEFR